MKTNKSNRKKGRVTPPSEKERNENPEAGSGKQDREQGRGPATYDSVNFDQEIQNEQQNDPERNPQKRKPLGENEDEAAKQGKLFEPGIDESTTNV